MKSRAFTLVELMIVVLVIGILLAMAIPEWVTSRENSRQKTCLSNLTELNNAKEQWATEFKKSDSASPTSGDLVPSYLKEFPLCPTSGTYTIGPVRPECNMLLYDRPIPSRSANRILNGWTGLPNNATGAPSRMFVAKPSVG